MFKENPKDTNLKHTLANLDIAFEPYATCDEIVPLYEKKYDENKGNIEFLEKVCKVLDHKDCNDAPLFFKATEALHALKPTPKTAYLMAKMCDGKKLYNDVINYLKNDIIQIDNDRDQVRAYLLLAKAYSNENKFTEARNAAKKALDINPEEGKAYILIGYMYAMSAKNCGDDPQVSQKAAYWAAVDKFRKAKEVDASCAADADRLVSTYSQHFPSGDDLFFVGVAEGSTYRVGCWIQENTIVRKRP
jgi:tetratricopeptide (TPR) repeat protein